jgi:hypothetical protein
MAGTAIGRNLVELYCETWTRWKRSSVVDRSVAQRQLIVRGIKGEGEPFHGENYKAPQSPPKLVGVVPLLLSV